MERFPEPTTEMWLNIAEGFKSRANFPRVLGKHVRVIKPSLTGSLYYNYKHYFSILLLAIILITNLYILTLVLMGNVVILQFSVILFFIKNFKMELS